jgi:hypothetical protein
MSAITVKLVTTLIGPSAAAVPASIISAAANAIRPAIASPFLLLRHHVNATHSQLSRQMRPILI